MHEANSKIKKKSIHIANVQTYKGAKSLQSNLQSTLTLLLLGGYYTDTSFLWLMSRWNNKCKARKLTVIFLSHQTVS